MSVKILVDVDVLEALLFFGTGDDAQSPMYAREAQIVRDAAPDLREAIQRARMTR